MKNTTSHQPSDTLKPSLRVAFRSEDIVEEKKEQKGHSAKTAKTTKLLPERVQSSPPATNKPQFDDYRIKAKKHDPL